MLPLNYAILKLFEDGGELDVSGVMERLEGDYRTFKAFKAKGVNESLMSAEKNGLLEESRFDLSDGDELRVFYRATEEGRAMIGRYIGA